MARLLVLVTLLSSVFITSQAWAKQMICTGSNDDGSDVKVEIGYEYENLPATELNIYIENEKKYSLVTVREYSATLRGQDEKVFHNEVVTATITNNEWALLRYPSEDKGKDKTNGRFTLNMKNLVIDDLSLSCELSK